MEVTDLKNDQTIPKNTTAGIITFVGVLTGVIYLICLIIQNSRFGTYLLYGYQDVLNYISCICYTAACVLAGIAIITGKKTLLKAGAYTGIGASVVKAILVISWIISIREYYYSFPFRWVIYLIGALIGTAGLVLFALYVDAAGKTGVSNKKTLAFILMSVSALIELFFPLASIKYYTGEFGKFVEEMILGANMAYISFIFMFAGLIFYMLLDTGVQTARPQTSAYMNNAPGGYMGAPSQYPPQYQPQYQPQAYPGAQPMQYQNPYAASPQYQNAAAAPSQYQSPYVAPPQYQSQTPAQTQYQNGTADQAQPDAQSMDGMEKNDLINRYKELLDTGVISQEEFEKKRNDLLRQF